MKRSLFVVGFVLACAAPPTPKTAPQVPPTAEPMGTGRVNATALNVRADATADAEVLTTVHRGDALTLVEERDGWYRVRLASGQSGWVSGLYIVRGDGKTVVPPRRKPGCPPDSDYAFEKSPVLAFSDSGKHGLVVIEASVDVNGDVGSTRVTSNATGDPALADVAEREIRSAKFVPPIRNCVRRTFIFTYKRAF